jgi:hypothetical protein
LSWRTLEKHRVYGTGPKYSKIGGRIVYAVSDLREWVERGAKRSTSDPGRTTVLPAKPVEWAERGARRSTSDPAAVLPAKPINKRSAKSDGGVR